jgi:hypothetical protein
LYNTPCGLTIKRRMEVGGSPETDPYNVHICILDGWALYWTSVFCIQSAKNYTGQKKITQTPSVASLTNIRYAKTAERGKFWGSSVFLSTNWLLNTQNFRLLRSGIFRSARTSCSISVRPPAPLGSLGVGGPATFPIPQTKCPSTHFVPRQNVPVHILSQNNAGSYKVVFLLVLPPKVEDGKNPTKKVKVSGL